MNPPSMRITFEVVLEGSEPSILAFDGGGREFTLIAGRGARVDIQVNDLSVAERHAQFTWMRIGSEFHMLVEDLHSGLDTFVNGHVVDSTFLENGDKITLGNAWLVFRLTAPDPGLGMVVARRG